MQNHHIPLTTAALPRRLGLRWQRMLAAVLLVGGVHSQAAVRAADAETAVAATPPEHASLCTPDAAAQSALARVASQLQKQGMHLQAQCHVASGAWMVQVQVVDGMKASKVVRGPLADGHEVDMGTPAGLAVAGAPADAGGFSPDVQFNRQWLRSVMAQHRFNNLPDAWWHFAQQGRRPAASANVDLAAR